MLIGILSDSHGRAQRTAAAVEALRGKGADLLIHLGDVETDAVIDELVGHPVRIVFGNCDEERTLGAYARGMGLLVDHPMGELNVCGRRVAYTHGHMPNLIREALARGVDYLLHGHTHETCDLRHGPTRIVNPGALHRAARYTAAILDPEADALEVIEIRPSQGC
jgi:putative phosphoesterase